MPWGLLLLLAVGLLLGWLLLVLFTAWVLTHPPRRSYAFAVARNLPGDPSELAVTGTDGRATHGLAFTQWQAACRGGDLPVWDVRGLDPAGPVIIMTHGWGDSRVVMLPRLAALAPLASRIILWDLPAHGDAPRGRFTLGATEFLDLSEIYERVVDSLDPTSNPRIYFFGFSLGAGVSMQAAALLPVWKKRGLPTPAGVIAESPYRVPITPARNVLRMRGLPFRSNIRPAIAILALRFGNWFRAGHFDRAGLELDAPLLIIHGSADPICPIDDARAIAAAARSSRLHEIPGAGHNNLWTDPAFAPRVLAAVADFLDAAPRPRSPAVTP